MLKRRLRMILDKARFFWYFVQYLAALLVSPFIKGAEKYHHLWIISERGTDAGDNGYHLFKYIREHHPKINIKYIISSGAPDRPKVEKLGEVINYRSFSHMLAFVLSEVKISTHIMGFSHDMYFFRELDRKKRIKGKKIFLQHGIIKDDIPYLYASENNLDLFVCGAGKEYEYIRDRFGYPAGVIRFLGLCRYDALLRGEERRESRMILLMPTWRTYMERVSKAAFKQSRYFQAYQSLLGSRRLHAILKKYGYRLKFFPHHEMLPYLDCFDTVGGSVFLAEKTEDIQKNLIKADLLITDFSSVFFDFAYMGKPCVYYQFDKEEFRSGHYLDGYFSYEEDAFGPVVYEEDELLQKLEAYMKNGCKSEELYRMRADDFFTVRDRNNCRRNYDAIQSLLITERGEVYGRDKKEHDRDV